MSRLFRISLTRLTHILACVLLRAAAAGQSWVWPLAAQLVPSCSAAHAATCFFLFRNNKANCRPGVAGPTRRRGQPEVGPRSWRATHHLLALKRLNMAPGSAGSGRLGRQGVSAAPGTVGEGWGVDDWVISAVRRTKVTVPPIRELWQACESFTQAPREFLAPPPPALGLQSCFAIPHHGW